MNPLFPWYEACWTPGGEPLSGRLSQWDICDIGAAWMPRVTAGTTARHVEGGYALGPLRNPIRSARRVPVMHELVQTNLAEAALE